MIRSAESEAGGVGGLAKADRYANKRRVYTPPARLLHGF